MAVVAPIPYGDVCFFTCNDRAGNPQPSVSVERKHAGDMSQCIHNGRLLFQMQRAYSAGYRVVVIVEDEIQPCPATGLVQVAVYRPRPPSKSARRYRSVSISPRLVKSWIDVLPNITYSRFDQYLTELDRDAGVIVKRSRDIKETVAIIKALWLNFQTPPEDHQSLHQIYSAPPPNVELLSKPSLVRRIANQLPGVGWQRSKAVAGRFKTTREMVNAPIEQWMEIDGIGKKTSRQIVQELSGGDEQ